MRVRLSPFHRLVSVAVCTLGLLAASALTLAADVTAPARVTGLSVTKDAGDALLSWNEVTTDATGNPETIDHYRIFRGESPDFVPDKSGGSNQVGTSATTSFTDPGAASGTTHYYYRVTAVDTAGNESRSQDPTITTPPTLSGYWTDTTIELEWTDAEPVDQVTGYRVYYGRQSRGYEFVDDVGMAKSHSLTGLETNVNWFAAVVAVDPAGNESDFSNEHVDPVGGTIDLRAHNESYLCWGEAGCPPQGDEIGRRDGWQKLVPVDFPVGDDWSLVTVSFTMDSRLCDGPSAPDRCGDQNPGWNPCGDPWDRTAHLFLVLDDCVDTGGSCITHGNLELIRAITPFGTDAPPPDGNGRVPPRVIELDITPYAPLLAGQTRYVGAEIVSYVPAGWWVTTDFHFSKRPEEASPKPPADGFAPLFFGGVQPPTATVSIPSTATQVFTRLFTTGHGGNSICDGGSRDGEACGGSADCPGGSCENCDEFCHRTNQIIVDGSPVWETVPWRNCCFPRGSLFCEGCQDWNSCGYPSCTFNRAGWCPGQIACHYDLDAGCDQDLDLTSAFPPGGTYDVDYDVLVNRGSWSVSLFLYWYEGP